MSAAVAVVERLPRRRALTHVRVIVRRNLLRNIRHPELVVGGMIQPMLFLVLFNAVFGGAMGQALPAVADGRYVNWLMPGLLIQVSVLGAGQTAMGFTEDMAAGAIDRFRSLPMARSAVLLGRTIADLVRNACMFTLLLLIATAIGFRHQTSPLQFLAGVGIGLLFGHAMSWMMATIGLFVRSSEATQTAVFLPMFPLVFLSSVFVPTDTMPEWLRGVAEHQPVTVVANAVRGLMLGAGALPSGHTVASETLAALAWIAALTALFVVLAMRVYRRMILR